ncbi:MAG: nucleotide pyrophosphohydrolase [Dermatophilaceae bacterium]|nr:nucleotide pyrophosphohydrolase [Intrasporangiaceae bacterium]
MDQSTTSDSQPYGLTDLQAELRAFREERDWAKFHDPKSLILALVGEVGELAELFQWIPADRAVAAFGEGLKQQRAAEEMSDILIYLLGLADVLDVDLLVAARSKLAASRQRFPADELRGVAPEKH